MGVETVAGRVVRRSVAVGCGGKRGVWMRAPVGESTRRRVRKGVRRSIKASSSFLKKRTKKLLDFGVRCR
jgi:hypothetical protein